MFLLLVILASLAVSISIPVVARPNAFVSIHIQSPEVRTNVKKVQQEMVAKDRNLKSTMVSVNTLHITLMVLRLSSEEEERRALKILCNVTSAISMYLIKPVKIMAQGIGTFGNHIIFAEIVENKLLADIASKIQCMLKSGGFPSTDLRRFIAHLSIAKVHSNSEVDFIPPYSYSSLKETYFGMDFISKFELLSINKPKDMSGYYYSFGYCQL